jgi:hypothetical protein
VARKKSQQTKSLTSSKFTEPELTPAGQAKYVRVCEFFEKLLRHSKGQTAGKNFLLLPWQKRFEGAIDRSILRTYDNPMDGRHYCRLDSRALLRGDTQARVALYQFLFNCGAISPNELRDLEDLDLLENPAANATYMQLGFAPLGTSATGTGPDAVPADSQFPADTIEPEDIPDAETEPTDA